MGIITVHYVYKSKKVGEMRLTTEQKKRSRMFHESLFSSSNDKNIIFNYQGSTRSQDE